MANTLDFSPICDQVVLFLSKKFPGWIFNGSVLKSANLVQLKINYKTQGGRSGTVYFDENNTPADVLRKFDMVKLYAQTPAN